MLEILPKDVSNKILLMLNLKERAMLFRVSKAVRRKASDPVLWFEVSTQYISYLELVRLTFVFFVFFVFFFFLSFFFFFLLLFSSFSSPQEL